MVTFCKVFSRCFDNSRHLFSIFTLPPVILCFCNVRPSIHPILMNGMLWAPWGTFLTFCTNNHLDSRMKLFDFVGQCHCDLTSIKWSRMWYFRNVCREFHYIWDLTRPLWFKDELRIWWWNWLLNGNSIPNIYIYHRNFSNPKFKDSLKFFLDRKVIGGSAVDKGIELPIWTHVCKHGQVHNVSFSNWICQ